VPTECIPKQFEFQDHGFRKVVADFSGGRITSDGGGLLLREIATGTKLLERFADCFVDNRNQAMIEHTKLELLSQRIFGLALGYEDLNDHDDLRADALLATLVGKVDPTGEQRVRERDKGYPLAGKSTLNRLELAPAGVPYQHRYHKIVCDPEMVDRFFVDAFLRANPEPPDRIILDFDATDDPLHGDQEGSFFNGYYDCYCYMPLYVFCDDHLLCARLRPSNIDASLGAEAELERMVAQIREQWPNVQIILRGDSGFCRSGLMDWCDENGVDYILGLSRSPRLVAKIARQMKKAKKKFWKTQESARYYRDFKFRTLTSWSRSRRVVGKAEQLRGKENPRFVVTSLSKEDFSAQQLYEDLYCARGDMENRIKEQQLCLFADRTSSATFSANHLRMWFSGVAYVLMTELRRIGLRGTKFSQAQCSTIRTKLLKVGALVSLSVRRIWVRYATGYPYQRIFATILQNLRTHYMSLQV